MKTSIKDIALALNLSTATVSWILSGQGEAKGFSENTIRRVREYAESVNYRPNLLARGLSLGVSRTLGLIIPFLRDSFYSQLAYYIEKEAEKKGYLLIVCSSEGDGNKEYELICNLLAKQVDGVILAPTKTKSQGINYLLRSQTPFVLVDRFYQNINTNYVIVDNYKSSYDIVNLMLECKAKKIALIVTDVHLHVMKQRVEGYREALFNAGINDNLSLEVFVDRNTYQEDIVEKLDYLLSEHPDVDSFFFATHYLAMATIKYMVRKGIEYKKYIMGSIHTMDGLDVLVPNMFISYFPIEKIGSESVSLLLKNINEGKDFVFQNIVLQNILAK